MKEIISLSVIGIMKKPDPNLIEIKSPFGNLRIGFSIETDFVEIGRQPQALPNFILDVDGVSRRQAQLYYQDSELFVVDMGSDNGTWLITEDGFVFADPKTSIRISQGARILFGVVVAEIL